jgi:inhibitor of KinA
MTLPLQFRPLGDTAVRVGLPGEPGPALHRTIQGLCRRLDETAIPGVVEWVPTYTAITVFYRPHVIRYREICRRLERAFEHAADAAPPAAAVVTLPVCYGGRFGPDLESVAEHHELSVDEVIRLHSGPEYLVYMMGFAPGFPYLTGLPERLATPRLATPRLAVPAGSVGIGGEQTGVYPLQTPGGWRIIGHTPVRLYDPAKPWPMLLSPGDYIRFHPVGETEHADIQRAVGRGTYGVERKKKEGGECPPCEST